MAPNCCYRGAMFVQGATSILDSRVAIRMERTSLAKVEVDWYPAKQLPLSSKRTLLSARC